MIRSALSKAMWVGRTTSAVVGLAVALALVLGAASMAMSATGKPFILGKMNAADQTSKLVKRGAGAALSLRVNDGEPPLKVDSSGKVAGLNADQIDGKDSSEFTSYKSTVVASPVGSDTENGSALLDALAGIDASQEDPALLYIEPGTYDLGDRSLQMKQHVDIQGAGELQTIITSPESTCTTVSGTVNGANNAELRFLTVRNTGTGSCGFAIYNDFASPRLTQVTAESTGAGTNSGVYNDHSSPTMTNVTATASGGTNNYGVYNASSNSTMTNVTVTASGGSSFNYGVINSSSSSVTIRHSRLSGTNLSLYHAGGTARVALTQLVGPIQRNGGATLQCFDNYNDSLAPVSC